MFGGGLNQDLPIFWRISLERSLIGVSEHVGSLKRIKDFIVREPNVTDKRLYKRKILSEFDQGLQTLYRKPLFVVEYHGEPIVLTVSMQSVSNDPQKPVKRKVARIFVSEDLFFSPGIER